MRTRHFRDDQSGKTDAIPFPSAKRPTDAHSADGEHGFALTALPDSAGQVLTAIENMSRRIEDLARELNCLGYFDADDDAPRAA